MILIVNLFRKHRPSLARDAAECTVHCDVMISSVRVMLISHVVMAIAPELIVSMIVIGCKAYFETSQASFLVVYSLPLNYKVFNIYLQTHQ